MTTTPEASYRALLHVPTLGRVLISMQIARVAQSMVSITLVLFTLDRTNRPPLPGGFAITLVNLTTGMTTIVLPLIVIQRFGLNEAVVGLVFAASGISGMASAFHFGRMDTRGREWLLLVWPIVAMVPAVGLLLVAAGQSAFISLGVGILVVQSLLVSLLYGPIDIALFTVRQRRTDPAWTGRAFAVSMAFNFLGLPTGAAVAGLLAERSIETAILILGVGGALAAAGSAALLVPRSDPAAR